MLLFVSFSYPSASSPILESQVINRLNLILLFLREKEGLKGRPKREKDGRMASHWSSWNKFLQGHGLWSPLTITTVTEITNQRSIRCMIEYMVCHQSFKGKTDFNVDRKNEVEKCCLKMVLIDCLIGCYLNIHL